MQSSWAADSQMAFAMDRHNGQRQWRPVVQGDKSGQRKWRLNQRWVRVAEMGACRFVVCAETINSAEPAGSGTAAGDFVCRQRWATIVSDEQLQSAMSNYNQRCATIVSASNYSQRWATIVSANYYSQRWATIVIDEQLLSAMSNYSQRWAT